jgi:VCBS repeat-containing protein
MKYLLTIMSLAFFLTANGQNVKLVQNDTQRKVDVMIDGKIFTSYQYPENQEKPFLFPVYAPNGSVVTRGYPIEPRKGERVDHPHHIGLWFNHGNVNGLDFWNNSSAIPANKKNSYGHISVQKILKAKSGKTGTLEVASNWDDNKGKTILTEKTKYIFSGDKTTRTVDHIAVLTAAVDTVIITDNKEGLIAIRVDRAFEMPSKDNVIYTDEKGIPTTVKATDNTGVTGMYVSSNGNKGDAVWGTRNEWVILTGTKDNTVTSMAIFDNPKNPGFPAYSHARGYGLFAINDLGQTSYDPKQEKKVYVLKKGESMTLYHRFYIQSGSELTPESAVKIFKDFSKAY